MNSPSAAAELHDLEYLEGFLGVSCKRSWKIHCAKPQKAQSRAVVVCAVAVAAVCLSLLCSELPVQGGRGGQ